MNKYLNIQSRYCLYAVIMACFSFSTLNAQSNRAIDGFGNNINNPTWGANGQILPRISKADYADGISVPKLDATFGKVNPRIISNAVFAQTEAISSEKGLGDFTWVFGQFIDHDIILSDLSTEVLTNVVVPNDDEFFLPGTTLYMQRTLGAEGTGTDIDNPRQHANNITAFLDLSGVYGSDLDRATWLRSFEGGKLKVSKGNMLPWNTVDGNFNSALDVTAPFMADDTKSLIKYYVAGDVRANENPLLISFHTLFVREHNRLCDELKNIHPGWNDERLYQAARSKLIAIYQHIIYNEWLPALGVEMPSYTGYNPQINPQIFNEFATAAFRLGHTLINKIILRMDNQGEELSMGNISLRDAFFNPFVVEFAGGIDPYFKGMGTQMQQEFDAKVIDDVRNFLFGTPSQGGLDLASININRGRERGLADYNTIRFDLGLPKVHSFMEITGDQEAASALSSVYGDVNNIDPWVGMLSEKHVEGSIFGQVVNNMMERQFRVLRDGDRFYYENMAFDTDEIGAIQNTTMRDILMRNTGINLMQKEVFVAMPHDQIEEGPELIPFPLEAVIFPNPVEDVMKIKLYGSKDDNLTVTIVDYMGKILEISNHHIYLGNNTVEISLTTCPRGYYNVILDTSQRRNVLKMVKK